MTPGDPARRPRRVALTGGIATGKSYCLAEFEALGVPVIDADLVARAVVPPGSAALEAIAARFGPSVLTSSGDLDRAALGRVVFAGAQARHDLEAIVHPAVYTAIGEWFARLERAASPAPAAIAAIPLLYETGHERDFDYVVVTVCRPELQLARLTDGRQLSAEEAVQRIASQMPLEEKARRADWVIDTSGNFEETNLAVRDVWSRLTLAAG